MAVFGQLTGLTELAMPIRLVGGFHPQFRQQRFVVDHDGVGPAGADQLVSRLRVTKAVGGN